MAGQPNLFSTMDPLNNADDNIFTPEWLRFTLNDAAPEVSSRVTVIVMSSPSVTVAAVVEIPIVGFGVETLWFASFVIAWLPRARPASLVS